MNTVIIADPDRLFREKLKTYFEQNSFEVVFAKGGSAIIKGAIDFHPGIIICNASIKGMDVMEVFKTLQQIDITSTIPFIVVIDDKSMIDHINNIMLLAVDGVIIKPALAKSVYQLTNNIIQRRKKFFGALKKQLHPLYDSPFIGVMKIKEQHIEYVNAYFSRLLNFQEDELLHTPIGKYFDHDTIVNCFLSSPASTDKNKKISIIKAKTQTGNLISLHSHCTMVKEENTESVLLTVVKNGQQQEGKYETQHNENGDLLLTKREEEILFKICEGYTNYEIAEQLCLSDRTVQGHRARLMNKINARNSVDLIKFAIRNGLIEV